MNREQLKTLINEAIKEVLSEKTPKGFNPKLKKQITAKKKSIKEQEKMPMDPQASAKPDAGEVEGPESQDLDADPIIAQIDSIIGSLNSLKSKLSGETEEAGEEEVSDEETD
jgi:hypothetical protein